MKKITKLTSVFLALAIFASMCVFHVDAALNKVLLEQYDVVDDVHYAKYNITSKVNAYTKTSTMLTFSPDDGYIPMVFSGYSGTSGTLATQYTLATQRYGYDVVGIINGAFFSMDSGSTQYGNYGTLNGIVISDGKIASAHAGYSDSVVAFGSDGSMNIVNSALDYKLYIEGAEVNGLYYINKTSGSKIASNWKDGFYYYDRSCGTKCDTYAVCPGYEVLCKKVDNTDLSVGHTLIGEVVSVTENTYGGAVGTDEVPDSLIEQKIVQSRIPTRSMYDVDAGVVPWHKDYELDFKVALTDKGKIVIVKEDLEDETPIVFAIEGKAALYALCSAMVDVEAKQKKIRCEVGANLEGKVSFEVSSSISSEDDEDTEVDFVTIPIPIAVLPGLGL